MLSYPGHTGPPKQSNLITAITCKTANCWYFGFFNAFLTSLGRIDVLSRCESYLHNPNIIPEKNQIVGKKISTLRAPSKSTSLPLHFLKRLKPEILDFFYVLLSVPKNYWASPTAKNGLFGTCTSYLTHYTTVERSVSSQNGPSKLLLSTKYAGKKVKKYVPSQHKSDFLKLLPRLVLCNTLTQAIIHPNKHIWPG